MKPENFLFGRPPHEEQLHLIDFGLARRYVDEATGEHIKCVSGHNFIGTLQFATLNTHLGFGMRKNLHDDHRLIAFQACPVETTSNPFA